MNHPTRQSAPTPASTEGASKTAESTPILVDAKRAAAMLSISPRKLWELTNCGAIERVRIDRAVRYRVADLEAWVAAGCPSRKEGSR